MTSCLMSYLNYPQDFIKLSALRIIGNICTCNNSKMQKVLDEGLLKYLKVFLTSSNNSIRKDAVWIISNLAVGTQYQIENLIEENFFPILKEIISNDLTIIRKECTWAICNLTNNKNPYHAEILIEQGIIESLYDFLSDSNPKFIIIALEAISNFLEIDDIFYNVSDSNDIEKKSILRSKLIPMGFLEVLDNLQYHPNQVVYERTSYIIDNYLFTNEDDMYYLI